MMDNVEVYLEDEAYFKQRTKRLQNKTIPDLLINWSKNQPDKEAVVVYSDGHERRDSVTYGDLVSRAKVIGSRLISQGLKAGARVGLLGPNSIDWVLCCYGAIFSGASVLKLKVEMLNDPKECQRLLQHHQVDILLYSGNSGEKLNDKLSQLRDLTGPAMVHLAMSDLSAEGEADDRKLNARLAEIKADDPAVVFFSSGTTGAPKAVINTHSTTIDAGLRLFEQCTTKEDIFWGDRSFSWTASFLDAVVAVHGCTAIYSPPSFDSKAKRFIDLIQEEKITCCVMIPLIIIDILEYGRHHDISAVRNLNWVMTGGEGVTSEFWDKVKKQIPGLFMIYAASEVLPICTTLPLGVATSRAGVVCENIEIKIIGDDGVVMKRDEQGEIWIRSPRLFPGYLDQPERTAKAIDARGWYQSGDIGSLSRENLLKVVGRKKFLISRGGVKIHPSFVEKLIQGKDGIKTVCVIGVPDPRLYEKICACVVLAESSKMASDDIMNLFKAECELTTDGLGLIPDHVLIFQELPVSENGKFDRDVLEKLAQERL